MTMSCDGFFAGPNGELDWMTAVPDAELNADIVDLISSADSAFIGYPTAVGMIPFWRQVAANPEASDADRAVADAIGKVHAYVLTKEPVDATIEGADILVVRDDDELRETVRDIKNQPGRDIGVPGGVRSARTFARLGLFDEYVLMMHPVALGEGQRVFSTRANLIVANVKTYTNGVTRLTYVPRGPIIDK
jgi:dihydrofolate reductase